MMMRAKALLERSTRPIEAEMRMQMSVNLCRCGAHMRILRAVRRAAVAGLPGDLSKFPMLDSAQRPYTG